MVGLVLGELASSVDDAIFCCYFVAYEYLA